MEGRTHTLFDLKRSVVVWSGTHAAQGQSVGSCSFSFGGRNEKPCVPPAPTAHSHLFTGREVAGISTHRSPGAGSRRQQATSRGGGEGSIFHISDKT
jgi:hypothetical protein